MRDEDEEPLIHFVNQLLKQALAKSASDIHIEPFENFCRIRFRQDGLLYPVSEIPTHFAARLITRLKIMARLNIAERRLPQDGRFQFEIQQADVRVSSCPTLFGEKVVLRIAAAKNFSLEITDLGLTESQQALLLNNLTQPQSIILVTGPTGSGKTATLYSALRYLNSTEKNISTIEDPIEIQLEGINQINIHPKIGLTFAAVLRTILRQDPDILMIGEIRDSETAAIAMQAAQTGHLVLSTLHTNSAVESFQRLQTMGLDIYNLAQSISLIISQRLIRKLCPYCKIPETISIAHQFEMDLTTAYQAQGCEECLHGYQGRTGIYECLPLTEDIIPLFSCGKDVAQIYRHLQENGFLSLRNAGAIKVREGITSVAEINRTTRLGSSMA